MRKDILISVLLIAAGCAENAGQAEREVAGIPVPSGPAYYKTIGEIPVPQGYQRVSADSTSFAYWLRSLPLKKDKTVYLYDGSRKANQSAQYAVLDIPRSEKDLMQCADVVMKLRAEYLFSRKRFDSITFSDYAGKAYKWTGRGDKVQFEKYLDRVFGWCGSASLEKQLKPVKDIQQLQAGDVYVKGGFPGHAMIVADLAVNSSGDKIYMLVQGYQPAQDMHVVINPVDAGLSPWYKVSGQDTIKTPEWWFYKNQLRRW